MALTDKQIAIISTVHTHGGSTLQSKVIDQQSGFFTEAQVKGIVTSLASKNMLLVNKLDDGDKAITLTGRGKAVIEPEATGSVAPAPAETPEPAETPAHSPAPVAKPAEEPKLTDADFYGKLSRKQCLEILEAGGYDGPVSYLMPKLRAITEQHGLLTTDLEEKFSAK